MPIRAPIGATIRALLLAGVFAAVSACSTSEAEKRAPGARMPTVEVSAVRRGEIDRSWSAVGSLLANESVMVRPEISGRIARVGFEEGQRVTQGSVLFALDDAVFQAQLAQAQANLALSTRNARRAEELFERQLVSVADRDTALAARNVDTAALNLARAQAEKALIRAPFTGRAGLRMATVGDYVNPGQDLVAVEDLDRVKLEFRLPELALSDVKTGQSASVELDAYPGERFKATLYAVDARVAGDTRSFAARAYLDNADGRLRPGLFARVELVVERRTDAMLVPEQAVLMRGAQAFVYAVEEGRAVEREIRVGQRSDGQVEVLSGLSGAERVVTRGLQSVSNGAAVQVASPPPA